MGFVPVNTQVESPHWIVKCTFCGAEVCTMERDEMLGFLNYLTVTNELVLCFDCESDTELRVFNLGKMREILQRNAEKNNGNVAIPLSS